MRPNWQYPATSKAPEPVAPAEPAAPAAYPPFVSFGASEICTDSGLVTLAESRAADAADAAAGSFQRY